MLRGTFRDEGEAPAGSRRSVTEEELSAVGNLLASLDGFVVNAQVDELVGGDVAQVEA